MPKSVAYHLALRSNVFWISRIFGCVILHVLDDMPWVSNESVTVQGMEDVSKA